MTKRGWPGPGHSPKGGEVMAILWVALFSVEAVIAVLAVAKSVESEDGGSDAGAN